MIIEDDDKLISTITDFLVNNNADRRIMRVWMQVAILADFGSYCWNVLDTIYAQGRIPADGALDAMNTLKKASERAIKFIRREKAL